ncbi:MAG TPA: hypothetical protein VFT62_03510 [Mycobacteriales bacterium]|nr:hypothetical protein [Mycobacteriales bacterium]
MLPRWVAPLVAKAKATAIVAATLTAGGVGGAVALDHVAPAPKPVQHRPAAPHEHPAYPVRTGSPTPPAAAETRSSPAAGPADATKSPPGHARAGRSQHGVKAHRHARPHPHRPHVHGRAATPPTHVSHHARRTRPRTQTGAAGAQPRPSQPPAPGKPAAPETRENAPSGRDHSAV